MEKNSDIYTDGQIHLQICKCREAKRDRKKSLKAKSIDHGLCTCSPFTWTPVNAPHPPGPLLPPVPLPSKLLLMA